MTLLNKVLRSRHPFIATTRAYAPLMISLALVLLTGLGSLASVNPIDAYDSREYLSISGSLYRDRTYAVKDASFPSFSTFRGEAPTRMRQPGYPLFLAAFYWGTGQRLAITQVSQVAMCMLTVFLLFLAARQAFGDHLSPLGPIAVGLYFPLWLTPAMILSESLFTFVLALFMFLLLRAIALRSNTTAVLAGVVLGAAALTKPIALPLAALVCVPIWLHARRRLAAVTLWLALLGGFCTSLIPWALRNYLSLGQLTFLSTDGGYNLWYASVPDDHPKWLGSPEFQFAVAGGYYIDSDANSRFIALAVDHIKADPFACVTRGLRRVAWVWSYFPGSQNLRGVPLAFAGFTLLQFLILSSAAHGAAKVGAPTASYYLLPAVAFSCLLVFTKGISRFILPSMPFLLILSGQGLHEWIQLLLARGRPKMLRHLGRAAGGGVHAGDERMHYHGNAHARFQIHMKHASSPLRP